MIGNPNPSARDGIKTARACAISRRNAELDSPVATMMCRRSSPQLRSSRKIGPAPRAGAPATPSAGARAPSWRTRSAQAASINRWFLRGSIAPQSTK